MSNSFIIFPTCPHCYANKITFNVLYMNTIKNSVKALLMCANCTGIVAAELYSFTSNDVAIPFSHIKYYYPEPLSEDGPPNTPLEVLCDLKEAKSSLVHGNFKSACIMAGNAVETACIIFGANKGGLKDKITYLLEKGIITSNMAEWAKEIRIIRNDAAHHAEKATVITKNDAEDAVTFANILFGYLFTIPAMIAKRRSKKES